MSYINNVNGIHKALCKKYRLSDGSREKEIEADDIQESTPNTPSPTPATQATSSSKTSSATAEPPTAPVPTAKPANSPTPPAPQPPRSTQPSVLAPTTNSAKSSDDSTLILGKTDPTTKDNTKSTVQKALSPILRGIGVGLKTKELVSKVLDDYAKRRMNTFLYYGGGFSPAMRQRNISEASRRASKFVSDAYLSGNGITQGNAEKVFKLIATLQGQRIPNSAKDHIISEITKAHRENELHKFDHNKLSKLVSMFKGKNNAGLDEVEEDQEDHDSMETITPQALEAAGNANPPTKTHTKRRRR